MIQWRLMSCAAHGAGVAHRDRVGEDVPAGRLVRLVGEVLGLGADADLVLLVLRHRGYCTRKPPPAQRGVREGRRRAARAPVRRPAHRHVPPVVVAPRPEPELLGAPVRQGEQRLDHLGREAVAVPALVDQQAVEIIVELPPAPSSRTVFAMRGNPASSGGHGSETGGPESGAVCGPTRSPRRRGAGKAVDGMLVATAHLARCLGCR